MKVVGFEPSLQSYLIFLAGCCYTVRHFIVAQISDVWQRAKPNLESAGSFVLLFLQGSLNFPFGEDKTVLIYGNFERFLPNGALFGLVM